MKVRKRRRQTTQHNTRARRVRSRPWHVALIMFGVWSHEHLTDNRLGLGRVLRALAASLLLFLAACPGGPLPAPDDEAGPATTSTSTDTTSTDTTSTDTTSTDTTSTDTTSTDTWCCYCVGMMGHGDDWICQSRCFLKPRDGCPTNPNDHECIGVESFEAPDVDGAPECPDGQSAEPLGPFMSCPGACISPSPPP
jgi:hypothetical protein